MSDGGFPHSPIPEEVTIMGTEFLSQAAIRRLEEIRAEMDQIAAAYDVTPDTERRFYDLDAESYRIRVDDKSHGKRAAVLDAGRSGRVERGTHDGTHSGATLGDVTRGRQAIDQAVRSGLLPDHAAERATTLLERGNDTTMAGRWATVAGDPEYLSAFQKLVGDPQNGHREFSAGELRAFKAVREFQRAMALSPDTAGGYMVPLALDPAIMLTSAGSASELRQVSRVVTITTDSWNGVTSAGVTAAWHAEAAEVTDNSPTLGQPTIPVHRGDAFVPFSFEVGMDAPGFVQEMSRLLADAADQLQTVAYTTGTGSGQPEGLITGLVGGPSVVTGDAGEPFVSADVYAVQEALPPRFQPNARWMGNVAILNDIAQFETTNGARLFPEVGNTPANLLRKPLHELSTMDATFNAAATEANHVLVYGDFSAGFVIVDRVGTTVELVPHLFGANRMPTGQRGLLMWFRTGSKVVVPNAFRLLNAATTA